MNVRMNSTKLEPSCTFHIFPSDTVFDVPPIVLNTAKPVVRRPSNNSPGQRKSNQQKVVVSTPFIEYEKIVERSDSDSSNAKQVFRRDDTHFPSLKSRKNMMATTDINLSDQAKFKPAEYNKHIQSETKIQQRKLTSASSEKTRTWFCTKHLRSRFAGYIKGKRRNGNGLDSAIDANRNVYPTQVIRSHRSELPESLYIETISPRSNYWTDSQQESPKEQKPGKMVTFPNSGSTESMKRVAEYILKETCNMADNVTSQEVIDDSLSPGNGVESYAPDPIRT